MIILVTGTPGAGKSLYAVSELLNKQFKDRPKFVNGIPDLLLEHTPISDEDVEHWYQGGVPIVVETRAADHDGVLQTVKTETPSFTLKNAVITVDEAQRIWRPRAASNKAPESVTKMEVHRHSGCDLILITQHPQQLDAHVRRLIGRHIHVRRTWGLRSAVVYEWDSCNSLSSFKNATSKIWRYNKSAFKLYKSSELHTKAGGRVPLIVWVLLATMLAFPFVGWSTVTRLLHRFTSSGNEVVPDKFQQRPAAPGAKPDTRQRLEGTQAAEKPPMTPEQYIAQYTPRLPGMMHTAPAYDGLTSPKVVPLPAACISSNRPSWVKANGGPCGCYTQTGQRYDTTQALCVQFVANQVFFPFVEPTEPRPAAKTPAAPATAMLQPPESSPASFNGSAVMAPPDTKSTVARDASVMAFMAKRKEFK